MIEIPSIKMAPLCEWDNEFGCNLLVYDNDNCFFEDRKGTCWLFSVTERSMYLALIIMSALLAKPILTLNTVCEFQPLNSNSSWIIFPNKVPLSISEIVTGVRENIAFLKFSKLEKRMWQLLSSRQEGHCDTAQHWLLSERILGILYF